MTRARAIHPAIRNPLPFFAHTYCLRCPLTHHPQKKADLELAKQREAEKLARSYDSLFNAQAAEDENGYDAGAVSKSVRELEEDFM
jgi:hypothetical protein